SSFISQGEDGIRGRTVTGVQTCALPISGPGVDELRRLLREADREYYEALVAVDTPVPPRPAAWRGPAAIAAALAAAIVLMAVSQLAPRRSGTIAAQPTPPSMSAVQKPRPQAGSVSSGHSSAPSAQAQPTIVPART